MGQKLSSLILHIQIDEDNLSHSILVHIFRTELLEYRALTQPVNVLYARLTLLMGLL